MRRNNEEIQIQITPLEISRKSTMTPRIRMEVVVGRRNDPHIEKIHKHNL